MKKYQKIILIIPASILTLILLVIAGTAFVFRNEISIYSSIRQLRPANREVLQGGIYEITDFPATNTCIVIVQGNKKRHASISSVDLSFFWCPAEQFQDHQGMIKYQIKNKKIIKK